MTVSDGPTRLNKVSALSWRQLEAFNKTMA